MSERRPIPVIDLFAGPGGLGEGFSSILDVDRNPYFSLRVSAEKDPTAHRTQSLRSLYRKFPKGKAPDCYYDHIRGDITREALFAHPDAAEAGREALEEARNFELGKDDPEDLDRRIQAALGGADDWVLIGGPPCQAYSLAGRSRRTKEDQEKFESDEKHFLYREYLRIIRKHKPAVFVMENVPNLLKSPEGEEIIEAARQLGFFVDAKVLLASRFGVPQNRRRTFIVGSRLGLLNIPEGNGKKSTVRDAFDGIPKKPTVKEFVQNGPIPTSALHIARNPTEISRKRYSLIPEGGNRFDLQRLAPELTPGCWIRKTTGGTDLFGRLEWDAPARCTIRTEFYKPEKGRYLHPDEHRPITHWEAARLQTFPDDFKWCGSKIKIAIQIGNAVPPKLAEAVARYVREHLEAHSVRRVGGKKKVRVD